MPFLILPVGAYLYGRFVDADDGIPWTRLAVIAASGAALVYFIKKGK